MANMWFSWVRPSCLWEFLPISLFGFASEHPLKTTEQGYPNQPQVVVHQPLSPDLSGSGFGIGCSVSRSRGPVLVTPKDDLNDFPGVNFSSLSLGNEMDLRLVWMGYMPHLPVNSMEFVSKRSQVRWASRRNIPGLTVRFRSSRRWRASTGAT